MIVYGSKINSDIAFPLDLSHETATRYEIEFSANIPDKLKNCITCGFPFYCAHERNVYLYSDRTLDGSETGQPWCYEVKDVVRFYWMGGERTIFYKLDEKGDTNLLSFWFIHLLLPLYFTLEDMYDFLHAGAVEVEGKPILFIAPSMGGKSTLTDYFIKEGHTLISDDKVPTFIDKDKFMVAGSHPYHRPYRRFEELGHRVKKSMTASKPIHAIYVLEATDGDFKITIDEIRGYEKFDTLMPNYLYMFSYLRPQRLQYLSEMVNNIRVFSVQVPWDLARLKEIHEMICEHSRKIQ